MIASKPIDNKRKRAPSRRSLETRSRILDAAETLFAARGFDGASMRDIAAAANVQVGLVHHHGGGKEALFHLVISRRADTLSQARLRTLAALKAQGSFDLAALLRCFFGPYVTLAERQPEWLAYARLVAQVSADPRWKPIATSCFDPTAQVFLAEVADLYPDAPQDRIARGFVYSVSSMLALLTAHWRIDALGQAQPNVAPLSGQLDTLITFCAAGMDAAVQT